MNTEELKDYLAKQIKGCQAVIDEYKKYTTDSAKETVTYHWAKLFAYDEILKLITQ